MTDPMKAADLPSWALQGEQIWGDNFDASEIESWYQSEREAYANLGARDRSSYRYRYHALNELFGFSRLPKEGTFDQVLGFGSAYGDELLPIVHRIKGISIVDPSDAFAGSEIFGVPARWVKPASDGKLPLLTSSVDLVTCFGVLHHIPNVSAVLGEIARVMKPGSFALIREPIVSMGDWRKARKGLTNRERGLPLRPFRDSLSRAGLAERSLHLCGFQPMMALLSCFGVNPYGYRYLCRVDQFLAQLSKPLYRYHARYFFQKIRPSFAFLVLEKR